MGAGERVDRKGGEAAAPLVELVHLAKGAAELTAKVFHLPCYKTAGHARPGVVVVPIMATCCQYILFA